MLPVTARRKAWKERLFNVLLTQVYGPHRTSSNWSNEARFAPERFADSSRLMESQEKQRHNLLAIQTSVKGRDGFERNAGEKFDAPKFTVMGGHLCICSWSIAHTDVNASFFALETIPALLQMSHKSGDLISHQNSHDMCAHAPRQQSKAEQSKATRAVIILRICNGCAVS